jgi:uncharacterized membrane protein
MHMSGRHQRRRQIHLLGTHGDMSKPAALHLLQRFVYPGTTAWTHFLRYVLLALGLGFLLAGIIFFFAYNWASLHRFAKMGIVGGLLLFSVIISLQGSLLLRIRRWFLLAAMILTGTLLGVYGQIYQTGADEFDFFMAWTVFSLGWAIAARFPLLWLGFVGLLNISWLTWLSQRQPELPSLTGLFFSGTINGLAIWISVKLPARISNTNIPEWYLQALGITAVGFHTLAILNGIYNGGDVWSPWLYALITIQWGLFFMLGIRRQSIFWPSILGLAVIIVIAGALIKSSDGAGMYLLVSLIIAAGVAGLVAGIALLQKKWENGTR